MKPTMKEAVDLVLGNSGGMTQVERMVDAFVLQHEIPPLLYEGAILAIEAGDSRAVRTLGVNGLLNREVGEFLQGVERYDLMEIMGRYSAEEQKIIASNLVGIGLTHGCDGGCRWCLFGKLPKPDAIFAYTSIVNFLQEFEEALPDNLGFYWDNDIGDYRDIDKTGTTRSFVDIYKQWRILRPEEVISVRTAIPPGSVDVFRDLVGEMFDEFWQKCQEGNGEWAVRGYVEISLGKHNARRVQVAVHETVKLMRERWGENLQTPEEMAMFDRFVEDFFAKVVDVTFRDEDTIADVGPTRVGRSDHDDFVLDTPACANGVVLGCPNPRNPNILNAVRATWLVAPTSVAPSGQYDVPLLPGMVAKSTPELFITLMAQSLSRQVLENPGIQVLMPEMTLHDGTKVAEPKTADEFKVWLAQEVLVVDRALESIESLAKVQVLQMQELLRGGDVGAWLGYKEAVEVGGEVLKRFLQEMPGRLKRMQQHHEQVRGLVDEIGNVDGQLALHIDIHAVQIRKLEFILGLFDGRTKLFDAAVAAGVLQLVGQKAIPQMELVFQQLKELDFGRMVAWARKTNFQELQAFLLDKFLKLNEQIGGTIKGDVPQWTLVMTHMYSVAALFMVSVQEAAED